MPLPCNSRFKLAQFPFSQLSPIPDFCARSAEHAFETQRRVARGGPTHRRVIDVAARCQVKPFRNTFVWVYSPVIDEFRGRNQGRRVVGRLQISSSLIKRGFIWSQRRASENGRWFRISKFLPVCACIPRQAVLLCTRRQFVLARRAVRQPQFRHETIRF